MLCVLSLIVSGFLGIFFASYRELAKESLGCLLQKARTGECDADLNTRLKSTVVSKAINRDRRLAKFLNNYIEYISWGLVIVFIVSAAYLVLGIYNYLVFGHCGGPQASGGCSFQQASELWIISEIKESIKFWI
jgi:hypothetical protein